MGRTACTEPQCLNKGTLYLIFTLISITLLQIKPHNHKTQSTAACQFWAFSSFEFHNMKWPSSFCPAGYFLRHNSSEHTCLTIPEVFFLVRSWNHYWWRLQHSRVCCQLMSLINFCSHFLFNALWLAAFYYATPLFIMEISFLFNP